MKESFSDHIFPFGAWRISYKGDAVTGIRKVERKSEDSVPSAVSERAAEELGEYFRGERREFTFRVSHEGTPFQEDVWKAAMRIPYGETVTYKELSEMAGHPGAVRAVGTALRMNPLQMVIPCHRVVPSSGGTGGYAGGRDTKMYLLETEKRGRK